MYICAASLRQTIKGHTEFDFTDFNIGTAMPWLP